MVGWNEKRQDSDFLISNEEAASVCGDEDELKSKAINDLFLSSPRDIVTFGSLISMPSSALTLEVFGDLSYREETLRQAQNSPEEFLISVPCCNHRGRLCFSPEPVLPVT